VAEADHFKQFVRLIARRYRHLNPVHPCGSRRTEPHQTGA
jgi:hypothetical protein